MPRDDPGDELLTPEEAARLLRRAKRTLETWRYRGYGPPWVRVGRTPMYRRRDIEAWLEQQRERP